MPRPRIIAAILFLAFATVAFAQSQPVSPSAAGTAKVTLLGTASGPREDLMTIEIADKVERSKTKLVLMTAGCPETCHRSIANLAREIEARGVPTLIFSASPAATESVRPPRAMTFEGSVVGRVIGRAGDREFHKKVVRAGLEMFTHVTPPGKVVTRAI